MFSVFKYQQLAFYCAGLCIAIRIHWYLFRDYFAVAKRVRICCVRIQKQAHFSHDDVNRLTKIKTKVTPKCYVIWSKLEWQQLTDWLPRVLIPNPLTLPLLYQCNAIGHAGNDLVYVSYVKFSDDSCTSRLKLFERFFLDIPAHSVPLNCLSHCVENIFNTIYVRGTWGDFESDNLVVL